MLRFAFGLLLAAYLGLVALAPVSAAGRPKDAAQPWSDPFDSQATSRWSKADGWSNGDPFNVGWRADHVTFADGIMTLTLDDSPCPNGCSGEPYASGEYRTNDFYGYGRYEVRMKAAAGSGLVSSFFTYSDPYARPGVPWDEIDIEILGKNPTKMQTNYFTSGVGGHESTIDLGFDASAAFHTYAIEWSSARIAWYVDGLLRHVEEGARGPLPSTPGRVMMNLWAGRGVDSWLGTFQYAGPVRAEYDLVQVTPQAGESPPPAAGLLHVHDINVAVQKAGGRYQAVATVQVLDANGAPMNGVAVRGAWSGATAKGDASVKTDATGRATFYSGRTASPGPFNFCVTNLILAGWTYAPAQNNLTCVTASY